MIVDMTNMNGLGFQSLQSHIQVNQVATANVPNSHMINHQAQAFINPHVVPPPPRPVQNDEIKARENIHHCQAPGCQKSQNHVKQVENIESKHNGDVLTKKREKKGGRRYNEKVKQKSH